MLNHHEKLFILLTLAILFMAPVLFSKVDSMVTAVADDAIAIRVIANPNHYSALRWYKQQKFTGSPQSIIVDGYEGIRDGRTVYVNAANISGSNLYTNIYLISYNQDAENATVDILGQMLQHWKFNDNISAVGYCRFASSTGCALSSDCPKGDYCLSVKSKVIRDTRRMADLVELKFAVDNYKNTHGFYPKLSAGSYLANKSVSTWPSWRERLGTDLGIPIPVDPVNLLGDCGGANFNPITCWDENSKRFAGATGLTTITLPVGSMAYAYAAAPDGTGYMLYIGTESGVLTSATSFSYNGGTMGGTSGIGNSTTLLPPSVTCGTMSGVSGQPFTGGVNASNPSGGTLTWTLSSGWSAGPVLQPGSNINQKRIWAASAGSPGNFSVSVTVSNAAGASATVNCPIVINGRCGDGQMSGAEQCDNGANNQDTCSATYGSACSFCNKSCASDTVIGPYFGDGIVTSPNEPQCDSANLNKQSCQSLGFVGGSLSCDPPGIFNTSGCNNNATNCGDGILNSTEQCDNGINNTNSPCIAPYDGTCPYCDLSCHLHVIRGGYCGDTIMQAAGGESCDDGANNASSCMTSYGSSCSFCDFNCRSQTMIGGSCGDGIIQTVGGEVCDNGLLNSNTPCVPPYNDSCSYCNAACQPVTLAGGTCGDSRVDAPNEECDTNGGPCSSIAAGGFSGGNYACNADCTYDTSTCSTNCIFGQSNIVCNIFSLCGNGVVDASEECDAGSGNGSCPVACSASCMNNICHGSQTFTTSGTFNVPPTVTQVTVQGLGGGGGAGSEVGFHADGTNGGDTMFNGVVTGGGGHGGYATPGGPGGAGGAGGGSGGLNGFAGGSQVGQTGGTGGAAATSILGAGYGNGHAGLNDGGGWSGGGGGGGGGGGYYYGTFNVTPGSNISVVVGAGGTGWGTVAQNGILVVTW